MDCVVGTPVMAESLDWGRVEAVLFDGLPFELPDLVLMYSRGLVGGAMKYVEIVWDVSDVPKKLRSAAWMHRKPETEIAQQNILTLCSYLLGTEHLREAICSAYFGTGKGSTEGM